MDESHDGVGAHRPVPGLADAVRRLHAREPGAERAFVDAVTAPLRESVRRRIPEDVRRRVDTDDVFQSAVTDAIAAIAEVEFRGERQFLAWLDAVAARRAGEAARRHRAQRRDVHRDLSGTHLRGAVSPETTPPDRAENGETSVRLRAAIARLPDDERRCVEMRSYDNVPFGDIAVRLGLTDRHAARRLYRAALDRLGDALEDAADDDA